MKRSQSLCIAVSGPSSCWREILRTHCWLAPAEPVYIRRRLFWRPCFHAAAAAHEGHHPPCTSGRGLVTLAITCGWAEKPLLVPRSPQGQRLYSSLAALRQIAAFIRSIVGGLGRLDPPVRTGPLMRWRQQNVVKHVFGHVEVQLRLMSRHMTSMWLYRPANSLILLLDVSVRWFQRPHISTIFRYLRLIPESSRAADIPDVCLRSSQIKQSNMMQTPWIYILFCRTINRLSSLENMFNPLFAASCQCWLLAPCWKRNISLAVSH